MTATTKAIVHEALNAVAAEIANRDPRLDEIDFSRFESVHLAAKANMFRPALGSKLGLEYDDAWLENPLLENKEEFIGLMRQIAVDSMRKALVKRSDLFVGVILGEARAGRDYFSSGDGAPPSKPPDALF